MLQNNWRNSGNQYIYNTQEKMKTILSWGGQMWYNKKNREKDVRYGP